MKKGPYDKLVGKLIRINTAAPCGLIKGDVIRPIKVSYVRSGLLERVNARVNSPNPQQIWLPLIWWVDEASPEVTRSLLVRCPTLITLIEEDEQNAINAVMGQIQVQLGKLDLTIYSPRVKLVYMSSLRYLVSMEFIRKGSQ